MYQLEERILFDGAAAVDLAVAQQEQQAQDTQAQAQADAAAQAAATATSGDQTQTQNPHEATPAIPADTESSVPTSDTASADHSSASLSAPMDAFNPGQPADTHHVNVLVVSDSLENADELFKSANSDTIVVRYNEKTTTGAELLQEITDSLNGEKADSIGFVTDKAHDGAVSIFSDSDTSTQSLSTETQKNFWNGVEGLLSENGKVNIFASDLASTENGRHLVDSLSEITNHQVAASTDVTGDADAKGNWELEYVAKGTGSVDLIEEYFNRESIQSFDHRIENPTEIAFIDSSVGDIDTILKGIGDDAEIVYLNKDHAFEQITSYLQGRTDVDSIHLVSEGASGKFYLGNETINNDFVAAHHDELASWGKAMSADGDIHIYGCNVAKDQVGKDLVNQISVLTGADVAASTDRTGIDGNWNLEFTAGEIQTAGFVIGDYQYNLATTTYTVMSLRDAAVNISYINLSTLTLREALYLSVNGDSIEFGDQITVTPTIYLIDTLVINANITIDGTISVTPPGGTAANYSVTIDAKSAFRALSIDTPANAASGVVMSNMNFVNGSAGDGGGILITAKSYVDMTNIQVTRSHAQSGGGIYNAGTLNLLSNSANITAYKNSNLNISGNTATSSGGGIYNSGTLTYIGDGILYDPTDFSKPSGGINNNTVTGGNGGGIYNSGSLTITSGPSAAAGGTWSNFSLSSNSADSDGGAIYSNNQNISLTYVLVNSNSAMGSGGGIYIFANSQTGAVNLGNVDLTFNMAGQYGGGFYFTNDSVSATADVLTLDRFDFISNTAMNGGGAYLANATGAIILSDTEMTGNTATVNGGALGLSGNSGTLSIKSVNIQTEFRNNSAAGNGGAIYVDNCNAKTALLSIDFVNISGNSAANGGGIYVSNSTGSVTLTDIEMASNSAMNGGGIYCSNTTSGIFKIFTSNISNNSADVAGGGIYMVKGQLTIQNSTLSYNGLDINTEGGAIYMESGNLHITLSTIAYNMGAGAALFLNNAIDPITLTVNNTLVYNLDTEYAAGSFASQIYLADSANCKYTFSTTNNIYSHYYLDADPDPAHLHSLDLGNINANRLIGSSPIKATDIQSNLWLDETLRYHANYRTMALAVLSQNSWAIGAGTGGSSYDQRGNIRGTTWSWDQTKQTWTKGSGYTIGAFEPLFHVVIESKTTVDPKTLLNVGGDDSPLTQISDQKARYFINALGGYYYWDGEKGKYMWHDLGGTGLTLREAAYWIDTRAALDSNSATSYTDPTGGSNNFTVDDYNSRYIGFDSTVFSATTTNNIELSYGAIYIAGPSWGFTATHDSQAYRDLAVAYVVRNPDNSGNILYHDDTLRAPGAVGRITVTLAAAGVSDRFFYISSPSVADINNLTLTGGIASSGAGIYNLGGTVLTRSTLINMVVQNCVASTILPSTISYGGGIYNSGGMDIYDSVISGNSVSAPYDARGGGVYNSGTMNIDRTQIIGNSATNTTSRLSTDSGVMNAEGGGLYNSGSLLVERSEISGNSLSGATDASHNVNIKGGGIYNSSANFRIANSTIAQNTIAGIGGLAWNSYGSGIYNSGTLYAYYNTIANNQLTGSAPTESLAALYQANVATSSLFLSNNILVENIGGAQRSDIYIVFAASVNAASDYNIVGAYNTTYNWNVRNNIIGTRPALMPDPQYGIVDNLNLDFTSGLQYYGALTRSYRVLNYSVAMGSALVLDPSNPLYSGFYNLTSDQRGVDRGNPGDATNRGAFENLDIIYVKSAFDSATPRTGFDYVSYAPLWESSTFTLREAVNLADDGTGISFKDGWRINGTIDPFTGARVTNELDTYGNLVINLVSELAISRSNVLNFNPTPSISVNISHEINGGFSWFDKGGTIHEGGIAQLKAGANSRIFNINSTASLLPTVAIANLTVSGGNVVGNGGGIYADANLVLDNVTVKSCVAKASAMNNDGFGGGIYSAEGTLVIINSMIGGNTAASANSAVMGGGIYSASFNTSGAYVLDISSSSILNNIARNSTATAGDGGGIYLQDGNAYIEYSTIGMNKAVRDGGGIIVQASGDLFMFNCTVSNNSAGRNGGGISFYSNNTLALDFATVANNQSGWTIYGGASAYSYAYGGGIYMNDGTLALSNSILAQNYRGRSTVASPFHDDLYTNANVNNITYSVYGTTAGTGPITVDNFSLQVTDWAAFKGKLDTKLTENGGLTMTVYAFDSPYFQLQLIGGEGYDQTHLENFTNRITSGAYENSVGKTLYYVSGNIGMGRDGGSIWVSANSPLLFIAESDGVLNAADTVFAFDESYYNPLLFGKANLNNSWTLHANTVNNPNSRIELQNSGWLTINPGAVLTGSMIVKDSSTLELATPWTSNINLKVDHVSGVSNTTVIYDSVVTASTNPEERPNWFIQTIITQETVTNGAIKTAVEYDNLILTGNLVAANLVPPLNTKYAYSPLNVHGDLIVGTITGGSSGDLHDNVTLTVYSDLNINPDSGSHVFSNYGKITVSKDLAIIVNPLADLTMGAGGTVTVSGKTTVDGTVTMAGISILSKTVNLDNAYIIATGTKNFIGMSAQSLILTDDFTSSSPAELMLGLDRLTIDSFSRLKFISGGTVSTVVTTPADNIDGTLALSGKISLDNSFSNIVKDTAALELSGTVKIMDANIGMDNSLFLSGNISVDKSVAGDITITSNVGSVSVGSDVTADSKFTGNGKSNLIIVANNDAYVGSIYSVVDLSVTAYTGDVHLLNSITVSGNIYFETIDIGKNILVHKAFATDAAKNINTTPTPITVTAGKNGTINASENSGYAAFDEDGDGIGDGSELRLSAGSTTGTNNINTVSLNRSLTLLKGIYVSDGINMTESGSFINAGTFDNPTSNITLVNGSLSNSNIMNAASIVFTGTGSLINSKTLNADAISMYGGAVTNTGAFGVTDMTLTGSGALNNNAGSMTVSNLTMETGIFTNKAAFTADNGVFFTNAGKINNSSTLSSGVINLSGATLNNLSSGSTVVNEITITDNGSLFNAGKMLNAVIITITGNGSLVNTGTLVNADTIITFQDSASLTNTKTMTVNSIIFSGSGSLNNNGGVLSANSIDLETGNLNNKAVLNFNATVVNISSGNMVNTGTVKDLGGSFITLLAGDLTNKGSLTIGTIYMVADDLVSSGTLTVKDSLILNEVNLTLSGTAKVASLELVKDSVLLQGKMTVQDFYFGTRYDDFKGTHLSLQLNTGTSLEINGVIHNSAPDPVFNNHYFITQGNSKVWVKPGAMGTPVSVFLTDNIANDVTQIDLSSSTTAASKLVGLGTFNSVTTNGKYNGPPTVNTDIVNRTWTITRMDASKLTSTFHWTVPEEGITFNSGSANLYLNTGTGAGTIWSQVTGLETRHPLDYTNTNITKSGSYVIGNSTIAMSDSSSLGAQLDELKEKFIDAMFGTREDIVEQQQIAEALERSAMEDMFSQMANRGNLMERNKLFKTDVDLGLEALLSV